MSENNLGEIAALLTASFWVISSLFFEKASKRSSSLAVAYLRMVFALVLVSILLFITRGLPLPTDASPSAWLWLSLSGLVGFVVGDIFLFEAYVRIGARISLLLMSFSPILTGLLSYFFLGEVLPSSALLGIALTLAGIAVVILTRGEKKELRLRVEPYGVFCGVMGAVGQSVGTVLSKFGMGSYDPFAATQVRIISGLVGFTIVFLIGRHFPKLKTLLKDLKGVAMTSLGAFFGTTLGVGFSLLALQHTQAAVAAAIMSIMPVLIIPVNWLFFKERIRWLEVMGALLTVGGVVLLYLAP